MTAYPKCWAAMLVLLLVLTVPRAAVAQSCTVSGPTLLLGTVNPYSGGATTSGTGSYSCTNPSTPAMHVYACVSVGTGTGGTSATNRTLVSGVSTIPIQISTGGGSGQIGNGTSYPMYGLTVMVIPPNKTTSDTFPLVVTMPPPSPAPSPGSYTSSFAGTDAQFIYLNSTSAMTCAQVNAAAHLTTQANFSISATVPTQCSVSATGLAFPTSSLLTNPVTAVATIMTTCNAATPVTISLDNGASGTSPTSRLMTSGPNTITYGIYRDAAASLPWGSTSGTDTAPLNGTGTLTAYGRVPAQTSKPPGSYSDVVNVTITY